MTTQNEKDRYWFEFALSVACQSSGLGREALLKEAGISEEDLQAAAWEGISYFRQLWQAAERITGRPEIGLDIIDHLNINDFDNFGLAALTSNDLRSAFRVLENLSGSMTKMWRFKFVDHSLYPGVEIQPAFTKQAHSHHSIDSTISFGVFLANALLTKSPYRVHRACFRHDGFGLATAYEDKLQCVCIFNQKVDAVEFTQESISVPLPLRNPALNETVYAQLNRRLNGEVSFVGAVTKAIYHLLERQLWPNRGRVAELMGLGERTLLRKLKVDKVTFRDLQESALESEARRMLGAGMTAEDVAERLGYASSSPLARMLKRRTGCKLSELR